MTAMPEGSPEEELFTIRQVARTWWSHITCSLTEQFRELSNQNPCSDWSAWFENTAAQGGKRSFEFQPSPPHGQTVSNQPTTSTMQSPNSSATQWRGDVARRELAVSHHCSALRQKMKHFPFFLQWSTSSSPLCVSHQPMTCWRGGQCMFTSTPRITHVLTGCLPDECPVGMEWFCHCLHVTLPPSTKFSSLCRGSVSPPSGFHYSGWIESLSFMGGI